MIVGFTAVQVAVATGAGALAVVLGLVGRRDSASSSACKYLDVSVPLKLDQPTSKSKKYTFDVFDAVLTRSR